MSKRKNKKTMGLGLVHYGSIQKQSSIITSLPFTDFFSKIKIIDMATRIDSIVKILILQIWYDNIFEM